MNRFDHLEIVRVVGADARTFLQNQFSNDMQEISEKQFGHGAYLTPKGRVYANFFVIQIDEKFLLAMSPTLVDSFIQRLRMFIMRSDVVIERQSEAVFLGELNSTSDSIADRPYQACKSPDFIDLSMPGHAPRMGRIVLHPQADSTPSLVQQEKRRWQAIDVESGLPLVTDKTSEMFVPQALNLDLTGALSFSKGCFPGQEIAARLHYRGGINRRMFRATAEGGESPEIGTSVICESKTTQFGTVVNAVETGSNDYSLLVSVPLTFLEFPDLKLENGTPVELLQDRLPYEVPEVSESINRTGSPD